MIFIKTLMATTATGNRPVLSLKIFSTTLCEYTGFELLVAF